MATKKATKKQGKFGRGQHPNSRANLKKGEWQKGESGNSAGVSLGTKHRSTILNKWLTVERTIDAKYNPTRAEFNGTVEDEIVLALIGKAVKGDVAAIREILDTTYGKVADRIAGADGGAVVLLVKYEGEK